MKTKLNIDEDLKKYVVSVHDSSNNKFHKELCEKINEDSFDWHWMFKFENNYGASVIKRWRFFWIRTRFI